MVESEATPGREEFESQIKQLSNDALVTIAARAALRVLPLTVGASSSETPSRDETERFLRLLSAAFRATALSWYAARYRRGHEIDRLAFERASEAAGAAARIASVSVKSPTAPYFGAACASAANASYAVITSGSPVSNTATAVDSAAYAALGANETNGLGRALAYNDIWRAARDDLAIIKKGDPPQVLAGTPLWTGLPPTWVASCLNMIRLRLAKSGEWAPWLRWYDRRMEGLENSTEIESIFVSVPIEVWNKGNTAVNAWVAQALEPFVQEPIADAPLLSSLPRPIEDAPSLFTFGVNHTGQIDVMAGPQNEPVIEYGGDEETHRQWLEVAREQAKRLVADLSIGKFANVRRDYLDGLSQYLIDLPSEPGEGNFMLADAELITLLELFGAEASVLPDAFSARLNRVLAGHFALLDFYPVARRYHEAARKGRLSPPLPQGAYNGFAEVVRKNSPTTFAPRVTKGLAEAAREAPKVELDEADRAIHAAIIPLKYPYDYDRNVERRFGKAGAANALYKAVLERAKDPEKALAMMTIAKELSPHAQEIIDWLRKTMSG
ncbi:hypothetical protein [Methylocystis parvus]|uniref:hypothetical protein n=1 Tax=Methylocystis parvus TaxID=134 RepID=UPI003C747F19